MCKRLVIGLRVGVIAVLIAMVGREAEAAICTTSKTLSTQSCTSWRTTSSGVKYCALWCTGSEICDTTVFGLSGSILKECTAGETCPVVTCSAFGTVDLGAGCDPTTLDSRCGIQGIATCVNPGGNSSIGQPFTLEAALTSFGDVEACTKAGKCTKSLELDADDATENPCINPNWTFDAFTASTFNAQACFCPGGFDTSDQCCADSRRQGNGSCVQARSQACIEQRCTVDLSNYQQGDNLLYSCGPIPQQ